MINNPDDMGIYNPHIKEWVRLVKEAGGLAFYDHANFNGVMGKIRARDLGFDACMFMLHKTFGGAEGRRRAGRRRLWLHAELAPFLPKPMVVRRTAGAIALDSDRPQSVGKVREFMGNLRRSSCAPMPGRAAMGARGHQRGLRHLGAGEQLHGEEAARDPRRLEVAPRHRRSAHGDDALLAGPLKEETGIGVGRGRQPHDRFRRGRALAAP